MKISRQTIQVDGRPIHYEVAGEGEPIVLVHGLSESTRLWYRNVPTLAQHYRVYLVDLPGFGAMRTAHRHFKLTESEIWLKDWMQATGIEQAHLIGHSMGGYVSMALAARHPEKVKRLVLVDSIGIPFNLSVNRLIYPAIKSIIRTHPSFWACIGYDYLRAGPLMIRRAAQEIASLDASEVISTVSVPTLLIWGENDDLVPCSLGRQLHERLAGASMLVIPRTNHFCMFERPHEFNQALLAFLQGQDVGTRVAEHSMHK